MVHEPLQYLDTIAMLGAHRVVVHLGSTDDYEAIIEHARAHGYSIGFAATADIPQGDLEHFIPQIDFVQLMGIVRVGQQGQPFDTRTLTRARALREQYPDLDIAVDGAVNAHTIPQLYAAGVNRFAPGSAIATATDPAAAYCALAAQIGL
jgi:ribulose-phosphate 3-epimerase